MFQSRRTFPSNPERQLQVAPLPVTEDLPRSIISHCGYGSACLAGIAALDSADVVVFLDGDFSDYPEEMALLVDPIAREEADMVIGSRTMGRRERGALTPQAFFGNWLSCMLIRWFWSVSYTDLGPFRAIRHATLERLAMRDRGYGWTVEMQIKAAREGARVREAAVSYRRRIGKSKISGTGRGENPFHDLSRGDLVASGRLRGRPPRAIDHLHPLSTGWENQDAPDSGSRPRRRGGAAAPDGRERRRPRETAWKTSPGFY